MLVLPHSIVRTGDAVPKLLWRIEVRRDRPEGLTSPLANNWPSVHIRFKIVNASSEEKPMRRHALRICTAALCMAAASTHAGQWQPFGPPGAPILRPAVTTHPTVPGQLLVAVKDFDPDLAVRTHLSTDGGATWSQHSIVENRFSDVARDIQLSVAGDMAYFTYLVRFARSQDGTVVWTPLDTGSNEFFSFLSANPALPSEVVVYRGGSSEGFFHSLDAGTTGQMISAPVSIGSGTIDWSTRTIYAITLSGNHSLLSKPLDSGSVWVGGPVAQVVAASGGNAIAGTGSSLIRSSNNGASWQAVKIAGLDFAAWGVAFAPTHSNVAYAGENAAPFRVARSTDGGASFVVVGSIPTQSPIFSIAVEAGTGDRLLAATDDGVFQSVDGGVHWNLLPRSGDFPSRPAAGVLFDASVASVRYIKSADVRQRSSDSGATWDTLASFSTNPASPVLTSPTHTGLVFAVAAGPLQSSVLLRSLDGGASWEPSMTFTRDSGLRAMLPGDAPSEYFLFEQRTDTTVYRSTDEGATWNQIGVISGKEAQVARSGTGPLVLYAGVNAPVGVAGLFRSTDHGATWQAVVTDDLSGPVSAVAVDPTNSQRVFVAYAYPDGARILRTDNGGATWTPVWNAMPSTVARSILISPADPPRVFVGTSTQGVFASTDAGGTWSALDAGLSDKRVSRLDVDPHDPSKLYASTQTGPYVVDLSSGLPSGNRWAVEYFHEQFNHYFVSADADEIAGLDSGVFEGWARTGQSFRVGPTPSADQTPVCRFFGVGFAPLSSHFYTPYPGECEIVKHDPKWLYEKIAFGLRLPEANRGCLTGYAPLFRTWNHNLQGAPNHRYTTNTATFQQMIQLGWVMEGEASTFAFACVPQ